MIVVAIIGILAAVAIPMYASYVVRSQVAEGLSLSQGAKTAVAEYFHEQGAFPADNTTAGLGPAANIQGNYVSSVAVNGAVISILFGNKANPQINGQSIIMTATDNVGSLRWTCASSGVIDAKYLPAACR
jgi:type IV pilus assembly protein PilA